MQDLWMLVRGLLKSGGILDAVAAALAIDIHHAAVETF